MFYKNIQELPYRIYKKLPGRVKTFIHPGVRAFYFLKEVFQLFFQLRFSVFLLQGNEKWGHENLTTLFFGDETGVRFLLDLLYSGEPKKESLGKVFLWRVKSRIKSDLPKTNLVFINMHRFFSRFLPRHEFIIIPAWVLFVLDLSRPLPELYKLPKNKSLRENLRIFRRHNYSYEITHDPVKFNYFYDHMYFPYVMGKYGKITSGTGFKIMERIFRNGQLLLVKKGDDYVSGIILVRKSGDTLYAHSLGITEGNIEYLKTGALTAVYYFSILWAKEKGYKWLDFGECRSFLNDGVLNYKKSWGMEMKMSSRLMNIFGMKICNFHPGVRNFLENKPFIFIHQKKLKGLILFDNNHPVTLEEVQTYVKNYTIPGLDCLIIVSRQGFTRQAEEFANSGSIQRVQLVSSKEDVLLKKFTLPCETG